mmetsp:Transcript_7638/g.18716  ORF Transcript_7638/g.18716 Transcript_7638/m.18716 type:complete len:887 (+) Transcript_7638:199-2859(+)
MKKRIQVVPISSDDHSARSTDASTGTASTRSKIRLRNSSSKFNKRQQSGLFSKRPYLYKAQDQSILTSPFNKILYPNSNKGNAADDQTTTTTPVHWIDWLDSGMEFFGCGVTIGMDATSSEDPNQQHSSPIGQALGFSLSANNLQREQDILAMKKRHLELMERDYVQLHEDFFDSLLKEEGDQMLASITRANLSTLQTGDQVNTPTSCSASIGSAASSRLTTESTIKTVDASRSGDGSNHTRAYGSNHTRESMLSSPSVSSTTALRPNRIPRQSPRSTSDTASFDAYDEHSHSGRNSVASSVKTNAASVSSSSSSKSKKKQSSTILCIRDIMAKTQLEHPEMYLHTQCKLQKDRGRGERLGSAISARGRDPTLEKLRDKMKLIVEVSGELQVSNLKNNDPSSASVMSAGMKRRRAKISSIEHNEKSKHGDEDGTYIIETRSMIELQLGFLSMQYGLLLRWDAYRTGQVVFVCLRKMCHDSFYTKIRSPPTISTTSSTKSVASKSTSGESSSLFPKSLLKQKLQHSQTDKSQLGRPPTIIAASKKRLGAPPLVVRSPKGGNHAIYQRASGATEVVLVDAPYRVPPPDVFAPSILSLDVHQLTGLDPKSRWTLILTFDGDTEIAHLKYNHNEGVFETTRTTPCKWEISMMPQRPAVTSFDVATGLEIRLFEQRTKRRLRGVANAAAGMVGVRSSSTSSSSYVPAGSDPFSLNSPTKLYVVENQTLIHYNQGGHKMFRTNSETSLGSSTSAPSGSVGGSSSGRHSLKKSTSRLASTMTVPLGGLVCQPSTSQTTLWKLTIPFTHDEDAEVTLTLMHQSDYAHWLYQELRARRKEELAISTPPSDLWRILGRSGDDEDENYNEDALTEYSDDSDIYFMEWLYYCCFPTSV